MKDINNFIQEKLKVNSNSKIVEYDPKWKKELDNLLREEHLSGDDEIWSLWRNVKKGEMYLYKTESYSNLLQLWEKSKMYPEENGRYCSFQLSENSAHSVCNSKPFKKLKLIDKTK
jgi:hypothetical protein